MVFAVRHLPADSGNSGGSVAAVFAALLPRLLLQKVRTSTLPAIFRLMISYLNHDLSDNNDENNELIVDLLLFP